jgi:hypothetical protein
MIYSGNTTTGRSVARQQSGSLATVEGAYEKENLFYLWFDESDNPDASDIEASSRV